MLLKNKFILVSILFILIFSSVAYAGMCNVAHTRNALRKVLFDQLTNPSEARMELPKIKDLLEFYLNIDEGLEIVDCSDPGTLTGSAIEDILGEADNISTNLPTCQDGTEYGECSEIKPKYCYNGKLIDKCETCGCEQGYNCTNSLGCEVITSGNDDQDNFNQNPIVCGDSDCDFTESCDSCPVDCGECYAGCYDSDGGKDFSLKGYVQVDNKTAIFDYCQSEDTVNEYYCINTGLYYNVVTRYCTAGCIDGACHPDSDLTPLDSCHDSDNGRDYTVKGYVQLEDGSIWNDLCPTGYEGSIIEYYCSGSESTPLASTETYCTAGCVDGRCHPDSIIEIYDGCYDSDGGKNFTHKGYSQIDDSFLQLDVCMNENYVYEYYCSDNDSRGQAIQYCSAGCIDGACHPDSVFEVYDGCYDSDGWDYYTKGQRNYYGNIIFDVCGETEPLQGQLTEYNCEGNNTVMRAYLCPEGCADGACLPREDGTYCLDSICNGGETCEDCPEDCGSCSEGGYEQKITDLDIPEGESGPLQDNPRIDGDLVVWADNRLGGGDNNIHAYNLQSNQEQQITFNDRSQSQPSISGNKIVWLDQRNQIPYENNNYDIYMYDFETGQEAQITTDMDKSDNPDISGDKIVYRDARGDGWHVYMYDISTGQERRLTDVNAGALREPRISGTKVVYADHRTGDPQIFMYDISTNQETQITSSYRGAFMPDIDGDKIVWIDHRNTLPEQANTMQDVYLYDISTGIETLITTHTHDNYEDVNYARVSGNYIVWIDNRNTNPGLYLYDIQTGQSSKISASAYKPDISGDKIVYEDSRVVTNKDIYVYHING